MIILRSWLHAYWSHRWRRQANHTLVVGATTTTAGQMRTGGETTTAGRKETEAASTTGWDDQ